jgi:hypothetical protein
MSDNTKKLVAWLVVAVAIIVAGFLGVTYPIPAPPVITPQGIVERGSLQCDAGAGNCVTSKYGRDIVVYSDNSTTSKFSVDGATGDTTIAGNLAVSGSTVNGGIIGNNTAITGTLVVTGVATFKGFNINSSVSITPSESVPLTPTANLVTLTPAGAVGLALAACTTGQWTVLYNSVNASVVITDTGNGVLAGNQTLGQYDTLYLACIDSKWVQVSAISAN